MDGQSPFSSVFTTIPWDGDGGFAFLEDHLKRMHSHADRLRIGIPNDFHHEVKSLLQGLEPIQLGENLIPGLVRLTLGKDGSLQCNARANPAQRTEIAAICLPAPTVPSRVQGCKHGDWSHHEDARRKAEEAGCDAALFISGDGIIDSDRATPILLDMDGTAWFPSPDSGGVESVTLARLVKGLNESGIPVNRGSLTAGMVDRCQELVLVGSGICVASITELDGQDIGKNSGQILSSILRDQLADVLSTAWEKVE